MTSADPPGPTARPERGERRPRRAAPRGSLTVEVTTRCNRACAYCYNVWTTDSAYPRDELPTAALLSLVEGALRDSGLGHVQISGGEPFLRTDLFALVEGIRDAGVDVSLVSDGGLIDEPAARRLAELGVGPVQPTLLAANRDLHNALKGADCFDDTVAAITRLRRLGVPVSVAFVCTRRNAAEFRQVLELCFALGVRTVAFNRLCPVGRARGNQADLMPTAELIRRCLDDAEWANDQLKMNVGVAISLPLCAVDRARYRRLRFGRCALQSATPGFTVDPAGNLRACSISSTILGNLARSSWAEILARAGGDYFAAVSRVPEHCRHCHLLSGCGGGCRESALACFGTMTRPDPLAGEPPSARVVPDR